MPVMRERAQIVAMDLYPPGLDGTAYNTMLKDAREEIREDCNDIEAHN
jgi:hypothetical protein